MSSRPDCIFEIPQLWQSDFSRVCSNCYCSCSFEAEILKIGQSSHKMYGNNIQESMTILNSCTKKVWKLIEGTSYLSNYLAIRDNSYLSMSVLIYQSIYLSLFQSIYLSKTIHIYLSISACSNVSNLDILNLSIYRSIDWSSTVQISLSIKEYTMPDRKRGTSKDSLSYRLSQRWQVCYFN